MVNELPVPARGKVWVADVPESLGRFYTMYDGEEHLPRAQGRAFIPDNPPAGIDNRDPNARRYLYYPAGDPDWVLVLEAAVHNERNRNNPSATFAKSGVLCARDDRKH